MCGCVCVLECHCQCVICRQFVCNVQTDARLSMHTHPIGSLTRTSKWKRNFIYISADVCIYSQMIFIFISNTSIDIFCSFRVDFFSLFSLLFVVSLVIFMLLRFRAFLACGWFYSELMRRMRTNTNVLNCTMYVYIRTYNSHNDVAGVGVVSIIMFFSHSSNIFYFTLYSLCWI